jgi:Oxidoreductase molybdopterin binding domain
MPKLTITLLILISLLLAGCAQNTPVEPAAALKVGDGTTEKSYTSEQLESLGAERAAFNDITYLGVPLSVLITDAGFDPAQIKAVKAVAADGFSANYDASLFQKSDSLVSYAQADGPLSADDGTFRIVMPGQEGKLNVRQLVEIQIIP